MCFFVCLFVFFFSYVMWLAQSSFPKQGLNPELWQWDCQALTSGPSWNSWDSYSYKYQYLVPFWKFTPVTAMKGTKKAKPPCCIYQLSHVKIHLISMKSCFQAPQFCLSNISSEVFQHLELSRVALCGWKAYPS